MLYVSHKLIEKKTTCTAFVLDASKDVAGRVVSSPVTLLKLINDFEAGLKFSLHSGVSVSLLVKCKSINSPEVVWLDTFI